MVSTLEKQTGNKIRKTEGGKEWWNWARTIGPFLYSVTDLPDSNQY